MARMAGQLPVGVWNVGPTPIFTGRQLATEYPRTNGSRGYAVLGFREAAMPEGARGGIVQMSVLLLAIVATLWLVVCLNVANLFLARSIFASSGSRTLFEE